MKRLLITGARGFIGRHCLTPAIDAGYEVHALASSSDIPAELKELDVSWHTANLLVEGAANDILDEIKPTHVLHAAWITTHGKYWNSTENLTWLAAGTRLIEVFATNGGKRFVSVGSCAEYEWGTDTFRENGTPEYPATLYGSSKLAHHDVLQAAARHMGFSGATGRIFFAYGPYENPARLIPYACQRLSAGLEVHLSNPNYWRDFMQVSDVASGLIALVDSGIQGACNVCSGVPTRLAELIIRLAQINGTADAVRLGTVRDGSDKPARLVGSNDLLRSTGWAPKIPLEQGLSDALLWWRGKHRQS